MRDNFRFPDRYICFSWCLASVALVQAFATAAACTAVAYASVVSSKCFTRACRMRPAYRKSSTLYTVQQVHVCLHVLKNYIFRYMRTTATVTVDILLEVCSLAWEKITGSWMIPIVWNPFQQKIALHVHVVSLVSWCCLETANHQWYYILAQQAAACLLADEMNS